MYMYIVNAFPVPLFTNQPCGSINTDLKKMSDFKMDVIKWLLNFVSCIFGLKSYL